MLGRSAESTLLPSGGVVKNVVQPAVILTGRGAVESSRATPIVPARRHRTAVPAHLGGLPVLALFVFEQVWFPVADTGTESHVVPVVVHQEMRGIGVGGVVRLDQHFGVAPVRSTGSLFRVSWTVVTAGLPEASADCPAGAADMPPEHPLASSRQAAPRPAVAECHVDGHRCGAP